jgi:hypothetical protein
MDFNIPVLSVTKFRQSGLKEDDRQGAHHKG